MNMIKKKSFVVAMVSGCIICGVLVLTLIGYVAYVEMKNKERVEVYRELLRNVNAKVYSKHLNISGLNVKIESAGPLRGKPVIEGRLRNTGYREVSDIIIRVKLTDLDGAVLYEVLFHPQEPSLGSSGLAQVPIPYISGQTKSSILPDGTVTFKKILSSCPKEIVDELRRQTHEEKRQKSWPYKLDPEVISVAFQKTDRSR